MRELHYSPGTWLIAKDYILKSGDDLRALIEDLQLHALVTEKGERILKYYISPVRVDGQPFTNTNPELVSRTNVWFDGLRVRHWDDRNSVKFYNEHNVLRFEVTTSDPTKFKIYWHTQNQSRSEPKRFMPMRKGIADTAAQAVVSKNILNRFTGHMSAVEEKTRLGELLSAVTSSVDRWEKSVLTLDVYGKDRELLCAIYDPAFHMHAITNKKLQEILAGTAWAKGRSDK